jgi:hypothetical protein
MPCTACRAAGLAPADHAASSSSKSQVIGLRVLGAGPAALDAACQCMQLGVCSVLHSCALKSCSITPCVDASPPPPHQHPHPPQRLLELLINLPLR